MKKFNANIILFVLAFLFLVLGFSLQYVNEIKYRLAEFIFVDIPQWDATCLNEFTDDIDNISTKELRYHDQMMDVNSVLQGGLNIHIIVKDSDTIVKTNTGSLIRLTRYIPESDIKESVDRVQILHQASTAAGADFLYVAVPQKGYNLSIPENSTNYATQNYDMLIELLDDAEIPTLDLAKEMSEADLMNEDAYFITDHHWKPEIAFWANTKICEALQENYGFSYNAQYANIDNYTTTRYEGYFLGSYGKKVGTYFAKGGADDFTLIVPNFQTNLTESRPFVNAERTGEFTKSVLFMENLEEKNFYELNTYVTYGGGDFRLQIIKNNLNSDGKKIVVLRDSFACAVTPFLALQADELHIIDLRDFIPYEDISVLDYINEIQPDYVLTIYGGAEAVADSGRHNYH